MTTNGSDRRAMPLGTLLGRLRGDIGDLAGQELRLLRAELAEKRRSAVSALVLLAGALLLAVAGIGALVATLILVLAEPLPPWAAALIVTAVILAAAAGMALAARAALKKVGSPVPQTTIESVKEDVAWLTARAKSGATSS